MATPSSVDTAVDIAISRVLDAERSAHEDVDRATRNAAAIAEAARATARAIVERNERRIRTLRTNFETRAARDVAAIDAQAVDQDTVGELTPEDLVRAKRAVAALACELTGGTA